VSRLFEKIKLSQSGDNEARNRVLIEYKPFVAKTTSKVCGRYIDPLHDDEFSVAFSGFNEAIDLFDSSKYRSFLLFAETIIRNKLIDYFRQQKKFNVQVPFSSLADNNEDFQDVQERLDRVPAMEQFHQEQLQEARKLEINELQTLLATFGIGFAELVKLSPKHDDSRQALIALAHRMSADGAIIHSILYEQKLPLQELTKRFTVSRKTLERHRKYLIAITVILNGSFPHLRSFLIVNTVSKEEVDLP